MKANRRRNTKSNAIRIKTETVKVNKTEKMSKTTQKKVTKPDLVILCSIQSRISQKVSYGLRSVLLQDTSNPQVQNYIKN